jgi:hypothetical protein
MAKLVQVIQPGLSAPVLLYVICHLCGDVQFEVVGKDVPPTTVPLILANNIAGFPEHAKEPCKHVSK